ncbi:NAD(P)/FAD-dependent oxidoreductase [Macrococcus equi]|uniref:NAD(P)/FAD-dependent oxidoreductase n=1 Tax=Macrococcus equi TaxID=3395462 RepID=UPI0039BDDFE5
MKNKYQIVILGAGAGGISTASKLIKKGIKDILIVDHADYHAYQPAWPLVGSGEEDKKHTRKKMKKVIPNHADFIQREVTGIQAPERIIRFGEGSVRYEYLVVALGLQLDFDAIEGLSETLGCNNVCTNYLYDKLDYTYKTLKSVKEGNVIVTKPVSPIKGGVSPENSVFTFDEYFIDRKRNNINLMFMSGKSSLFPVERYRIEIEKHMQDKAIEYELEQELIAIDGNKKVATFQNLKTDTQYEIPFSMILVTPPMSAPEVIKQSTLSDVSGWMDVNPYTLQHTRHQNIFGIGDCTNLPTIKMGAAVRKQVPILVDNLSSQMKGKPLSSKYDGSTACPIATEYGQALIAEFGYDLKPKESMPFLQGKTNPLFYQIKKRAIPFMYWHGMLKGRG